MKLRSNDISQWYESLEDAKSDGYNTIKVRNLLQFYQLKGKHTVLSKDNIECIPDLKYVVFSGHEQRYYLKTFRGYDLDTFFWYRPTLTFSGEDEAVNALRNYIYDGNVHILLTNEQTENIRSMLKRLWKGQYVGDGTVPYNLYLKLLDQYLRLEDYRDSSQGADGYKTICNQFSTRIRGIWDEIYKTKK